MNERQMKSMIEFHRKAEKAYRASGQVDMAEQAKARRESLETELKKLSEK
jgi:hypothetical protein